MPDTPKKEAQPSPETGDSKSAGMNVRLAPVGDSDQPVVANYTGLNMSPGMAFIDFGFLEPAMLAELPHVAREGGKLPEHLNGTLAVRVALGYDVLAGLHQQLARVLEELSQAQERARSAAKEG
jgi:hypothetical protein